MKLILLALFFCLIGCSSSSKDKYSSDQGEWQIIYARDQGSSLNRPPLYRAFVPGDWERKDPSFLQSIQDTKKPICEYCIRDSGEIIYITIHTFPFNDSQPRIPSLAQLTRWKNQFEELDLIATRTTPEAHSGFSGLKLEAQGRYQNKKAKFLAWSMQLADEHMRHLNSEGQKISTDKLADYTIKVIGPPSLIEKHQERIEKFANSFEFIEELKTQL